MLNPTKYDIRQRPRLDRSNHRRWVSSLSPLRRSPSWDSRSTRSSNRRSTSRSLQTAFCTGSMLSADFQPIFPQHPEDVCEGYRLGKDENVSPSILEGSSTTSPGSLPRKFEEIMSLWRTCLRREDFKASTLWCAQARRCWHGGPDSPLHGLFQSMIPNGCTQSKAAGKIEVPPPNTKNQAFWNMAVTWNAIPDLRVAKSEGKAKQIVRKFVKSLPI